MRELVRRALLGDTRAQEECTRAEIVLPCPFCGKESEILKKRRLLRKNYLYGCRCKDESCSGHYLRAKYGEILFALLDWNTRPTPPIGHCYECTNWKSEVGKCEPGCEYTDAYYYCPSFKSTEDSE